MGLLKASKRDSLLHGVMNKRGESLSSDNSKPTDTKKLISMTALIFAFLVLLALGYGYFGSEAGQRSMAEALANVRTVTIDPVMDFFSGVTSVGSGDYFSYSTNSSSKKMGVDLSDFRVITGNTLPAGYAIDFLYEIEYFNVPRDSTYDSEFYCYFNITEKDGHVLEIPEKIDGEIIPSSEITIRRDSQPVCRFSGAQTEDLDGAYIIYGAFAFDYATEDVSIPVYFISGDLSDSLGDKDFFDDYGLDVSSSDLRTTYNGEPISIGIGVGGEGKEEQPVVVRSGDVISYNTIGITLRNEWNGNILELSDFTLSLPDGIELDDQLNGDPSPGCPFVFTGVENRYNTYKLDDSMVDLFDYYLNSGEFFGKSDYHSFQCWLYIDPEILSDKPYVVKEYKAESKYRYKINEKYTSISLVGADDSLIVEGP
ncbi:hypothetical protein J4467_03310 [Candidatus Woesearchaeota archaeon]|nr:hypothetical protein [Candidatus Woesearchaeota archaeon]